ncbi:MAG: hypothetical protein GX256_02805 [Fretibacterium sp.]|nr:hypothetical protein [Fretibacterium sp.]
METELTAKRAKNAKIAKACMACFLLSRAIRVVCGLVLDEQVIGKKTQKDYPHKQAAGSLGL